MPADAKRYAQALLEVVPNPEAARAELAALAKVVARTASYKQILLDASIIDEAARQSVIKKLFPKLSPVLQNLLGVLAADRAVGALPNVARDFSALVKTQLGLVDVLIESPYPLTQAEQERLLKSLPLAGKKPVIATAIDKSLIGGVRVSLDGVTYDASVAGTLEQVAGALL